MTEPTGGMESVSGRCRVRLARCPACFHRRRQPRDVRFRDTQSDCLDEAITRHGPRAHYHWQHEPCWYAVRGTGHWNGDRKQSTLWHIENRNQDAETIHSTQKPVECIRRPIVNNSSPGQAVYVPFSGSGTTIIACEKEARIALAIELEPAYVDVAVTRWQNFTGREAVLDGNERSFDEIKAERFGVAV